MRRWYVGAGYAGLGLPFIMGFAWMAQGAGPVALAMGAVGVLPFVIPAWKLGACARTEASDSRLAAFSAVAIAWSGIVYLWSLVVTASGSPRHDIHTRLGTTAAVLSLSALMCVLLGEVKAQKTEQKPPPPSV